MSNTATSEIPKRERNARGWIILFYWKNFSCNGGSSNTRNVIYPQLIIKEGESHTGLRGAPRRTPQRTLLVWLYHNLFGLYPFLFFGG